MNTISTTASLERQLSSQINLKQYLKDNHTAFVQEDLRTYVTRKMHETGLSKATLASRSGMSEVYLFQILSGRRMPSRDRVIGLCLALELSLEEAHTLLKTCGYAPLYAKIRRDSIIMYAILHKWTLPQLSDALYDEGEPLIIK